MPNSGEEMWSVLCWHNHNLGLVSNSIHGWDPENGLLCSCLNLNAYIGRLWYSQEITRIYRINWLPYLQSFRCLPWSDCSLAPPKYMCDLTNIMAMNSCCAPMNNCCPLWTVVAPSYVNVPYNQSIKEFWNSLIGRIYGILILLISFNVQKECMFIYSNYKCFGSLDRVSLLQLCYKLPWFSVFLCFCSLFLPTEFLAVLQHSGFLNF